MALEGPYDADRKNDTYMIRQVKKIAEEEGEKSPFKLLERDITNFLTAILIGTTTCTIYSAALAAEMVYAFCGAMKWLIPMLGCTIRRRQDDDHCNDMADCCHVGVR